MFRKPAFWAAFVVLSALCTAWAARHFGEAFPLVTLDVTMDRAEALVAAEELAAEHGWGPADADQAAAFRHDDAVQSFVELEAGGKQAYAAMLTGDLYSPYTWVVRRFREGETNESVVRFRPDGAPYGFREKLPEGFQRAEYLLDHGMLDRVTHRRALREELITLTRMLLALPPAVKGDLPPPEPEAAATAATADPAEAPAEAEPAKS